MVKKQNFKILKSLKKKDPAYFAMLADLYLQNNKPQKALKILDENIDNYQNYGTAFLVYYKVLLALDRLVEAKSILLSLLEKNVKNNIIYKYLAEISLLLGQKEESAEYSLKLESNDPFLRKNIPNPAAAPKESSKEIIKEPVKSPKETKEVKNPAPKEITEKDYVTFKRRRATAETNKFLSQQQTAKEQKKRELLLEDDEKLKKLTDLNHQVLKNETITAGKDPNSITRIIENENTGKLKQESSTATSSKENINLNDSFIDRLFQNRGNKSSIFETEKKPTREEKFIIERDREEFITKDKLEMESQLEIERDDYMPDPAKKRQNTFQEDKENLEIIKNNSDDLKLDNKKSLEKEDNQQDKLENPDEKIKLASSLLGKIYSSQGEYRKAKENYELLCKREPTNLEYQKELIIANFNIAHARIKEELNYYKKLLEKSPQNIKYKEHFKSFQEELEELINQKDQKIKKLENKEQ